MKKIRKFFVALALVFATGCSLLGGSTEAKAKEGWEKIQATRGETYYESCEYYHIYNVAAAAGAIYENNNVFDGKIFYNAYHEENQIWDYYRYKIASKQLDVVTYADWTIARQLSRSEGVAYHGYLGKAALESAE